MAFHSVEGLLQAARETPLWEAVRQDDCRDSGQSPESSWEKMAGLWKAMVATQKDYDPARRSPSGLTGGDGALLEGGGKEAGQRKRGGEGSRPEGRGRPGQSPQGPAASQ